MLPGLQPNTAGERPGDEWYPGKYLFQARDAVVAAAPGMQEKAAIMADQAREAASKAASEANRLGSRASDQTLGQIGGTLGGQIKHSHSVLSALANPAEADHKVRAGQRCCIQARTQPRVRAPPLAWHTQRTTLRARRIDRSTQSGTRGRSR